MLEISEIIAQAQQKGASDIHIVTGLPVKCRIDGKVQNLTEKVLTWEDCEYYAKCLAGDLFHEIECIGELDLARTFPCGARTRINLFRQQGAVSAAILNRINHTRRSHIITLEDPIEYIYEPDQCIINQREIGKDTRSYADGLRSILREDPDVILIGEMRDLNTIETALTAAETGHLVFATLHTNSAADSVDRMVNVFPEGQQRQIRLQLSTTLRAVLSQQLLPKRAGGRAAACEVMMVNSAIKNLIREGKTPQIDSFITMNAQDGSITMDNALLKMVREGTVTYETALGYARDREAFSKGRRG